MSDEPLDLERTLAELKRSSKTSLSMVGIGAFFLVGSLIYSATRLSPLENQIRTKTAEIAALEAEKNHQLAEIEKARKEYASLRQNIEKLYAVRVTSQQRVFELKAAAKATGEKAGTHPLYRFSVFINAPKSTLNAIQNVAYKFDHPTFNQKVQTSDDPEHKFAVQYVGWGCLTKVSAAVSLEDGETQTVQFNMCRSLGPDWSDTSADVADLDVVKKGSHVAP